MTKAPTQPAGPPRTGPLPVFTYFPDPVGVGSIVKEHCICECCNRPSEWKYEANIYCYDSVEHLCPWCIKDGSAAKKFDGDFHQDYHDFKTVPEEIFHEISHRTPGYITWQGNNWFFTKTDAMVFVGEVTGKELIAKNDQAQIQACMDMEYSPIKTIQDLEFIEPGGSPAIYMFQDRETGAYKAYWDCD